MRSLLAEDQRLQLLHSVGPGGEDAAPDSFARRALIVRAAGIDAELGHHLHRNQVQSIRFLSNMNHIGHENMQALAGHRWTGIQPRVIYEEIPECPTNQPPLLDLFTDDSPLLKRHCRRGERYDPLPRFLPSSTHREKWGR